MGGLKPHNHDWTDDCDQACPSRIPESKQDLGEMAQRLRDITQEYGIRTGQVSISRKPTDDPDHADVDLLELPRMTPEATATARSLGYDVSGGEPPSEFAGRVLGILRGAADVYHDRNAVYKDNFRAVGQVMVALFPEGRPPLTKAEEYDRWHIFELIIVKLTRYANNYDVPHEDSLLDMLPYLGILGGLDQELREDHAAAQERERDELAESLATTYGKLVGGDEAMGKVKEKLDTLIWRRKMANKPSDELEAIAEELGL